MNETKAKCIKLKIQKKWSFERLSKADVDWLVKTGVDTPRSARQILYGHNFGCHTPREGKEGISLLLEV